MITYYEQKQDLINYTIRYATKADIPAVRDVARLSWDATYSEIIPPETRAIFIKRSYSDHALQHFLNRAGKDNWFLVAESTSSGVVGFCEVMLRPGYNPDAEITRLYFLPEWQGHGIGTALLNKMLAILRGLDPESGLRPPRLWLTVAAQNQPAIAFYQQRGFRFYRDYAINLPETHGIVQALEVKEYMLELNSRR
jgi:ribosomal protein S18 acetylase RimI-like enzyme